MTDNAAEFDGSHDWSRRLGSAIVLPYLGEDGHTRGEVVLSYDHDDAIPGIAITITDLSLPYVARAHVIDGRVYRLDLQARRDEAVTQRDLRSPALIGMMRSWGAVGEHLRGLATEDRMELVALMLGRPTVLDEIRRLTAEWATKNRSARRRGGERVRGQEQEDLLRSVVDDYRASVTRRDRAPRRVIAEKYGYSVAHIGRLLVKARKLGLLDPAKPGRAGESNESPDQHLGSTRTNAGSK